MLFKIISVIPKNKKWQFRILLGLMVINGLLEALSVASILPFLHSLNESQSDNITIFANFITSIGWDTSDVGVFIICLVILSASMKILLSNILAKFIFGCEAALGEDLLRLYLTKTYAWFLKKNTSELGKNILSEIGLLVTYGLNSVLVFISQSILFLFIFLVLVSINFYVTILCFSAVASFYFCLSFLTTNYLNRSGELRNVANSGRFKRITEILSAIREFKIYGRENHLTGSFVKDAEKFAELQAGVQFVSQFPKFLLEGGILIFLMIVVLMTIDTEAQQVTLNLLILFSVAAYRMIPAAQQVFSARSQMLYIQQTVTNLIEVTNSKESETYPRMRSETNKYEVVDRINMENVCFRYNLNDENVLEDISVTFERGKIYGIVGETGSGKSTLVDLVVGLLEPTEGCVDWVNRQGANVRPEEVVISYVSQDYFLFDESFAYNISLAPDGEAVSSEIEKAARLASVDDVIRGLSSNYFSSVGESGKTLSGGQRQRVALARAFYGSPSLIVLDEATSALDRETENLVLKNIMKMKSDSIILFVTHRLEVLKICDSVIRVKNCRLN